jgi:hypothetical protein
MIIELTRSFLIVKIGDKTIKIHGELLADGFVAFKDYISHWEPPHHLEIIDEETKNDIIKHVIEKSNSKQLGIFFE